MRSASIRGLRFEPEAGGAELACRVLPSQRMRDGDGWEYKLVSMGNPLQGDVEERANAFGRLAWELVTIDAGVWVFKRPTQALEDSGVAEVELAVPVTALESAPVTEKT